MSAPADFQSGAPIAPRTIDIEAAAFAASPIPTLVVAVHGAEASIVAVNAAFCALSGEAAQALVGQPYPLEREAALEGGEALRAAVSARQAARVALSRGCPDVPVLEVQMAPLPAAGVGYLCVTHRPIDAAGSAVALQAALDQKTALLHELDHRVKNNLQVITSLVLLKARRTAEGPVRAALSSMADRIGALSTAHRLLYPVGDVSRFDLKDFVVDFAADLAATVDAGRITVTAEVESVPVAASKAAPLALLVHELATNAVRHAFPDERTGRIAITIGREGHGARVVVADDGVGRIVPETAEGFGRALVEMVVRQMRGTLTYESTQPGTRVTATLPLTPEEVGQA